MTLEDYLKFLGFDAGRNPFASVNARDERKVLEGYFVPPPYFETLWGDPSHPTSAIVLAPTGGGKTALAVMLDERAASQKSTGPDGIRPVLTILYDDFSRLGLSSTNQGLEDHFSAINYLITIQLIDIVSRQDIPHLRISKDDRLLLRYAFTRYVGGRASADVLSDLDRLRSPWEEVQSASRKVVNTLPLLSMISKALELHIEKLQASADLIKAVTELSDDVRNLHATPETDFLRLINLTRHYYRSVYFLVDRVDETPWTQRDAAATYELIHPLVANLNLLDRSDRSYAFKFFLWDGVNGYYKERARPDRIFTQSLDWNRDQLIKMLDNRVIAFSDERVGSVSELFDDATPLLQKIAAAELIAIFAGSSPRSMLTLCKYFLEEQVNLINHQGRSPTKIGYEAIELGLGRYANEMAHRLINDEKAIREITAMRRVVFSSKQLHSDVFRGNTAESVRSKVGKWKRFGVFKTIDNEITGKQGFPTEVHAFIDPCVGFLASGLKLSDFLEKKVRRCTKCGTVLLRDFDRGGRFQCHQCLSSFELPKATTEEQENRQSVIRVLAKELSKTMGDLSDIRSICRAANAALGDETFVGTPFLVWLRVIQHLDEHDRATLKSLLDILDEALPSTSRAKNESIADLYYLLDE